MREGVISLVSVSSKSFGIPGLAWNMNTLLLRLDWFKYMANELVPRQEKRAGNRDT